MNGLWRGPVPVRAVLALLLAVTLIASLLGWQEAPGERLLVIAPGPLSALLLWLVSRRLEDGDRRAWALFALGALSFGVGDAIWFWRVQSGLPPFPSLAAVFHGLFPLLLLAGLLHLPGRRIPRLDAIKRVLDMAVIGATVAMVVWRFLGAALVLEYEGQAVVLLVGGALLIGKLLLFVALLVPGFGLRTTTVGPHFGLLWLGVGSMLAADLSFGDVRTPQPQATSLLLYLWGLALLGLAGFVRLHGKPMRPPALPAWMHLRTVSPFLPYAAMLTGFAVLLQFILGGVDDNAPEIVEQLLLVATVAIAILSMVRQGVVYLENRALNASLEEANATLEARVAERSRELERSQARLMAVERLATLGQLTAGLAHEVNTPLAAAMNTLEGAKTLAREYRDSIGHPGVTEADHREIAAELEAAVGRTGTTLERLGELVRRMRAQGRDHQQGRVRFNPVGAAHEALALLEHTALKSRVDFRVEDVSGAATIHGEATRFMQVVTNLVQNAIHACEEAPNPAGSRVTLQFTREGDQLVMFVIDNGSGIPEAVQAKMFDPLYTTKTDGRGTGLGLAIVRDIVHVHFSGSLGFETTLGIGTTFAVRVPLAAEVTTSLDGSLAAGQIRQPSASLRS